MAPNAKTPFSGIEGLVERLQIPTHSENEASARQCPKSTVAIQIFISGGCKGSSKIQVHLWRSWPLDDVETLNVVEWKRVLKPVVVELREKSPLLCDQGAYRKWIQCRGHPSLPGVFPEDI